MSAEHQESSRGVGQTPPIAAELPVVVVRTSKKTTVFCKESTAIGLYSPAGVWNAKSRTRFNAKEVVVRSNFFTTAVVLATWLAIGTGADAAIRVARIDSGVPGAAAANQVFDSGDLDGTIVSLNSTAFNALSVPALRSTYDVLLFSWDGDAAVNIDWGTRVRPYLEAGGGIIFESPSNLDDIAAVVGGAQTSGTTTFVNAVVPGLTTGITNEFVNNHMHFTAWTGFLQQFLSDGLVANGLYGEYQGGRIVITGPDSDYHGVRGSSNPAESNQYNLVLNELRWVASGPEGALSSVPEPTSLCIFAFGVTGLGLVRLSRRTFAKRTRA